MNACGNIVCVSWPKGHKMLYIGYVSLIKGVVSLKQ